jgi:ABC-2 type transport system permease protein
MMGKRHSLCENLRIIWAVATKDIVDAIKNRTTLSIVIGVALLMLSGQAMPLILKLNAIPRSFYYDTGESNLILDLAKSGDLPLTRMPTQEEMEKSVVEFGGTALGLMIPEEFDRIVETGEGVTLEGFHAHWESIAEMDEIVTFFEGKIGERVGVPVKIDLEGNAFYPDLDAGGQPFTFSMTLVVVTITIGAFLVPFLMLEEKEKHTMEALLISPASYSQIVAGKAIAGLSYCLTAAAVVLAMNGSMIQQWGLAILGVACGALFTVAIGLLMGVLFESPGTMNMWLGLVLLILIMPVFLMQTLGGGWPEVVMIILPWLPSIALSNVVRISLMNSLPLDLVARDLGTMLGFAVLLLALAVWRVRRMDR